MVTVRLENVAVHENGDVDIAGDCIYISVEGHSGSGKKGEDIVCAGISSLTQSFVLAVSRVLKVRQDVVQREGFLETVVHAGNITEETAGKLKAVIGMMIIGLYEIKKSSPGSIEIIYDQRR